MRAWRVQVRPQPLLERFRSAGPFRQEKLRPMASAAAGQEQPYRRSAFCGPKKGKFPTTSPLPGGKDWLRAMGLFRRRPAQAFPGAPMRFRGTAQTVNCRGGSALRNTGAGEWYSRRGQTNRRLMLRLVGITRQHRGTANAGGCLGRCDRLFSLGENAIAKEPGSSYPEPWRCVSRLCLSAVPRDILFGTADEQVVLVLEVEVERADGNAAVTGDLLHRGLPEAIMAGALAGRLENPSSLVVHRPPPQVRLRTTRLTARVGRSTNVVSGSISRSSAGRK